MMHASDMTYSIKRCNLSADSHEFSYEIIIPVFSESFIFPGSDTLRCIFFRYEFNMVSRRKTSDLLLVFQHRSVIYKKKVGCPLPFFCCICRKIIRIHMSCGNITYVSEPSLLGFRSQNIQHRLQFGKKSF